MSSTNLLWVHSILFSMLLINMLKSVSPSMIFWGSLLVTVLHLGIEPLTVTLWTWPTSQLFIHWIVYLSKLYFSNLETEMDRTLSTVSSKGTCIKIAPPVTVEWLFSEDCCGEQGNVFYPMDTQEPQITVLTLRWVRNISVNIQDGFDTV